MRSPRIPRSPFERRHALGRLVPLGLGLSLCACIGERFDQTTDAGVTRPESPSSTATEPAASSTDDSSDLPIGEDTSGRDPLSDAGTNSNGEPSEANVTEPSSDTDATGPNDPDTAPSEPDASFSPDESDPPDGCLTDASACGLEAPGATETETNTDITEANTDVTESDPANGDDECPDVAEQTRRGPCGCGFAPHEACAALESGIAHRYSFDGVGTKAIDTVGDAHGLLVGTELNDSGILELDGSTHHVELPAGIISALSNATFEAWLRWDGGDSNQRIFNFGRPSSNDSAPISFISLSPSGSSSESGLSISFRADRDDSSENLRSSAPLPTGSLQHVAVVVDETRGLLSLYLEGQLLASDETEHSLNDLEDTVNWLGRPLYSGYPFLRGALHEFRIYDVALTSEELKKSYELGPSTTFSAAPPTR